MLSKEVSDKLVSTFRMGFTTDSVWGGSNTPFIRFGYWNKVDLYTLQTIIGDEYLVVEDSIEDSCCRDKYSYKLYKK